MSTSRLQQILDGLEARILTMYAGVTFALTSKYVASHVEAPPRIVWVRAADAFGPAQRTSPTQRAVLTRSTAIVAHCWAVAGDPYDTDDAAVEALTDALACAIRTELGADALPSDAEWIDPPSVNAGLACLVAFTVRQPVVEPTVPTTQATTMASDTAGASSTDGVLQCGEG